MSERTSGPMRVAQPDLPNDAAEPIEDLPSLDSTADLETVLAAWHTATVRLQRTHEVLREEVRHLTDELESKNRELARKNRLADLGQMASHIAHEVRNNLVPVSLYLSLLRRRLSEDPGSLDVLEKVAAGMTALDATVNDLLHFTLDRAPRRGQFELRSLVEDVLASLAPQLLAQAIDATIDVPRETPIVADQEMLRRVLLNLTLNALDVMPDGGTLVVTSYTDDRVVELEVADSGPGLSEDARLQVFEPFFTTKHGGTGLGLAIVERIAEAHSGEAFAQNCPEGGAAFTVRIPQNTAVMEAAA